MPLEPLPASREPGLVLRDEDRTLLSTLASDLRRHWQRARSSHFEAAEMVDLRMFVRGLADTCAQAAGFALAGQAQALDTALREAGWSGKRPDPARAQALGERVEALAAALSQSASTGRTPESAPMTMTASAPASAPRVFLVDSEPAQAKFLSLQLAAQGYAAESFVDWDALVHAMASRQPAALIADIDAPHGVFGGADQVSELRRAGKLLCPVLFLSARADSRTKLIALRAGGVGYFVKPVAAPELATKLSELISHQEPAPYRVVMVDDDRAFLELQSSRLQAAGFEVKALSNPLGVLEAAQGFEPDVFVLDLYMPEADGCELTRLIHEEPQFANTPVMLLSGESDPTAHARVIVAGAVDVIVKPADPVRFIERVRARAMQYRQNFTRARRPDRADTVTGLLTMAQFTEALEARLAHPREAEGALSALLYVSLGGYLDWSKRLDAARLEQVRTRIARVISERQQGNDIVGWDNAGRVIISTRQPDLPNLQSYARALVDAIGGVELSDLGPGPRLAPSIGVCRADAGPVHGLIGDAAQLAAQQAREAGAGVRLQPLLVSSSAPDIEEQRRWHSIINDAIREHRLFLVYQPITNLLVADRSEWNEVLLRMRDASGQTLLPGQFLPVAARFGLDRLLDRWVVSRALRGLDARQQDHPGTVFFVKLGTASIADPSFPEWLRQMLGKVTIRPRSCVFQLSQATVLTQFERCSMLAQAVRETGQAIAIEHFDGQPDALLRISALLPNFVKLDRSITQHLAAEPARQAQIRELVRRLKEGGAAVIAAYIEDAQSLGVLWQAQVELVQGNFVQQPDEVIQHQVTS